MTFRKKFETSALVVLLGISVVYNIHQAYQAEKSRNQHLQKEISFSKSPNNLFYNVNNPLFRDFLFLEAEYIGFRKSLLNAFLEKRREKEVFEIANSSLRRVGAITRKYHQDLLKKKNPSPKKDPGLNKEDNLEAFISYKSF